MYLLSIAKQCSTQTIQNRTCTCCSNTTTHSSTSSCHHCSTNHKYRTPVCHNGSANGKYRIFTHYCSRCWRFAESAAVCLVSAWYYDAGARFLEWNICCGSSFTASIHSNSKTIYFWISGMDMVSLSDKSDQPCQQLEIWNRFKPHEISNFPTFSFPFFCHYSIPFFLTHPPTLWVENESNLGITCDNI